MEVYITCVCVYIVVMVCLVVMVCSYGQSRESIWELSTCEQIQAASFYF